jgi:hypothetical protein
MWINVGKNQFHLPRGEPMRLRGHAGLVISDLQALLERLASVKKPLEGTSFAFREVDGAVEAVCPWGNRIRCYAPDQGRFGLMALGMPYVEFDVPVGTAKGIGRFYTTVFDALAESTDGETRVVVGRNQRLHFRETDSPEQAYDGHHIQVYVANISGAHERLLERELVSSEDSQHQFRFKEIIDPDDGRPLFTIEHEVRSMTHPMYARPLVNRNPVQSAMQYQPGHDMYLV